MKPYRLFLLIALFVLCPTLSNPWLMARPEDRAGDEKTIAVMGSSVAAGWVTSYEKKYDMMNGYAGRLERRLNGRGYTVKNISVPGDDTKKVIERMDQDLSPLKPEYVIIGLSLGNEGVEERDPQEVSDQFSEGLQKIIARCREQKIAPIVGSCYSCNTYQEAHYRAMKEMNLLINGWDIPSINFLGAMDNGCGHFPKGFTYDDGHPNNRGHEEMFYAIVPSLFDALELGKARPSRPDKPGFVTMSGSKGETPLSYIPSEIIHAFATVFSVRTSSAGVVGTIRTRSGERSLEIGKDGKLCYRSPGSKALFSAQKVLDGRWHDIAVSHRHLAGETLLFLDGEFVGSVPEQLEPVQFILAGGGQAPPETADYRDWMVYRSSLNIDEVKALHEGELLQASLEVYAPLNDAGLKKDSLVMNLAQSTSEVHAYPTAPGPALDLLRKKLEEADHARGKEPVFQEKKAIDMDPELLETYVGVYRMAPGADLTISREGNKLYLTDPEGGKAELFPESRTGFFIKFPLAELTIVFNRNSRNAVTHLVFSANGDEQKAKKVE
ncbi:MAG: GDSL-type esterase/lipase family protein [Planctomycetota bacterium]